MTTPDNTTIATGPIVIRNAAEAADTPEVPEHPHGRLWRFEMIFGGGALRAYADTPADLIAAFIPGYRELTVTAAAQARLRLACDLQVRLQAAYAATNEDELAACTPEQQALLLGNFSSPPAVAEWTAPIPLVLITTFYAPYRPTQPAPGGNILWLDTSDDWELLTGLAEAGAIALHTAEPELPAPLHPADAQTGPAADAHTSGSSGAERQEDDDGQR